MALPVDFWRHEQMLNIFRSKPCQRLQRDGACEWRSQCQYSHCLEWPRRPPQKHPYTPEICRNLRPASGEWGAKMSVMCPDGAKCLKAHSKDEVLYHPHIFKTTLCQEYAQSNGARGGKASQRPRCHRFYCPFAHGEQELRRSPLHEEKRKALIHSAEETFPSNKCCKVCAPDDLMAQNGEVCMWPSQMGASYQVPLEDSSQCQSASTIPPASGINGKEQQHHQPPAIVDQAADADAPSSNCAATAITSPQQAHVIANNCAHSGVPANMHGQTVMFIPMQPGPHGTAMPMAQQGGYGCGVCGTGGDPNQKGVILPTGCGMTAMCPQDSCYCMQMAWPMQASYMTPYSMSIPASCPQNMSPMPGKPMQGCGDGMQLDSSSGTFFQMVPPFPVQPSQVTDPMGMHSACNLKPDGDKGSMALLGASGGLGGAPDG